MVGFKAAAMLGRRCCDTICKIAVAQAGTCTTHERLTHKAMRGGLPPTVTLDVATAEGRLVTLTADPSAVWLGAGTGRLAVLHKVTGVLGAVAPEARKPAGTAWGETQTRLVYVGSYGAVDMEM
ncbi:MAG: hypothetical protein EXR47_08055 [Dehalococcoidia bacterium]|nr:hypothetical protein [Dehalococcoidia bacterium]